MSALILLFRSTALPTVGKEAIMPPSTHRRMRCHIPIGSESSSAVCWLVW